MADRGWVLQRSGGAQQGLFGGDPAHDPAGLFPAAAHLCHDLRLFQAARVHAVFGRAAALLSVEVEIARRLPGTTLERPMVWVGDLGLRDRSVYFSGRPALRSPS